MLEEEGSCYLTRHSPSHSHCPKSRKLAMGKGNMIGQSWEPHTVARMYAIGPVLEWTGRNRRGCLGGSSAEALKVWSGGPCGSVPHCLGVREKV